MDVKEWSRRGPLGTVFRAFQRESGSSWRERVACLSNYIYLTLAFYKFPQQLNVDTCDSFFSPVALLYISSEESFLTYLWHNRNVTLQQNLVTTACLWGYGAYHTAQRTAEEMETQNWGKKLSAASSRVWFSKWLNAAWAGPDTSHLRYKAWCATAWRDLSVKYPKKKKKKRLCDNKYFFPQKTTIYDSISLS